MRNASGRPQPEKRENPVSDLDLSSAEEPRSENEGIDWLSARTREVMAEHNVKWYQAWQMAERDFVTVTGRRPPKPPRPKTTRKVVLGVAGLGLVALIGFFILTGNSRERGAAGPPQIEQEPLAALFDDSVASISTLLGERDETQSAESFEWHSSPMYGCGLTRYARWPLTDYALGDRALREISGLGAAAGLRMFASSDEDGFRWLDDKGTGTWEDDLYPHFRTVGDDYSGSISEHHLRAQILAQEQQPFRLPLASISGNEDPPDADHGWFELNVCTR